MWKGQKKKKVCCEGKKRETVKLERNAGSRKGGV